MLDDPLSAVDTYVGKHIFEKCIKGTVGNYITFVSVILKYLKYVIYIGFLEEKTCVFVTDQLRYLTEVDKIVLMQNVSISNTIQFHKLHLKSLIIFIRRVY